MLLLARPELPEEPPAPGKGWLLLPAIFPLPPLIPISKPDSEGPPVGDLPEEAPAHA